MKNTIKEDLKHIGIMQKIYAEYLGISRQCLSCRLKRKETTEERTRFEVFLKNRTQQLHLLLEKEKLTFDYSIKGLICSECGEGTYRFMIRLEQEIDSLCDSCKKNKEGGK